MTRITVFAQFARSTSRSDPITQPMFRGGTMGRRAPVRWLWCQLASGAKPLQHPKFVRVSEPGCALEHVVSRLRRWVDAAKLRVELAHDRPLAGGGRAQVARRIDDGGVIE